MDLFADRIGNVIVSEGVVRIDLLRIESIDAEAKQRSFKPGNRLVLPVDTFMQLSAVAQQMREKITAEVAAQKQRSATAAVEPPPQ